MVRLGFTLDPDDWHGVPAERVWATPLEEEGGATLYRVENTPFYVKGVNFLDIVEAEEINGRLEFVRVVKTSGRATFRIIVYPANRMAFLREWQRLKALGCSYESSKERAYDFYAVDVLPGADLKAVRQILSDGKNDKIWLYDTGHSSS